MIINRLTMHNFGVYAGTNTFLFSHEKPIVLVGGMNGRGKTTFLEAILLSLYGSNSVAYKESKYHSYNKYLRAYVNKNSLEQKCYIELEFVLNESTQDIYLIRREWDALSKVTKESIRVWKNGEENSFLTRNWSMFVENILPSALSSFYFFDGEKIAELAVDDTNLQMKESIRAMLGITVLDVLKNDLGRSLKRTMKKSSNGESVNYLEQLREERDQLKGKLEKLNQEIDCLENTISKENENLEQLHIEYEIKGGVVLEQKNELMQKRATIQNAILQNQEALVGCAATELPLFLVKDLISQIKLQAEDEHNDLIMKEALDQMDLYLKLFAEEDAAAVENSRKFVEFIQRKNCEDAVEVIYGLSDHALFQTNNLVENTLDYSAKNAKDLLKKKNSLKEHLDEVDSHLSLDLSENETSIIYEKIKQQENLLVQLKVELSKHEQERVELNSVLMSKNTEFSRTVEEYLRDVELFGDADRMIKYSNMALKVIDAYTVELQKRKTGNLGRTITECYKKLANKKNLIHEIIVNPETLDMEYIDADGKSVSKNSLSAGEKQLMVIAILWALALCSKKKLPVIIDTPLSRLDSQHRTSIITTYFPNASDQTIILSTDTEIDHNYYSLMQDYVGDEFTLIYDEENKSTTIKKGYF